MMIKIVDDDYDERKLYRKLLRLKFPKFLKSNYLFSQFFLFFKKYFSKSRGERSEGWGGVGWCRNMKTQRKNSKLEFKVSPFQSVFFKANLFQSFFSRKMPFFGEKNISKSCGGGVVMKHEDPLGLYKPKTFSYWDLKIFNIFFKANLFQSFFPPKMPFLKKKISKSHGGRGGRGVVMEHEGPLGLYKPKNEKRSKILRP